MADSDKRLRYYNGQFLQAQDFNDEQAYHLDRQRRHNRQFHTFDIAEGLLVNVDSNLTSASVSPGTAIDGEGRVIVLTEGRTVQFNSLTGSVLVVIRHHEETSDPATVGDEGDTRIHEKPEVEVIAESGAPPADVRIRLARLQIAANGTSSQPDTSVRTTAGARLGAEVSIERIRLSRQGVAPGQWPVLSSGAAGQADVTGNLTVSGTISGQLATGIVGNNQLAANAVTAAKITDLNVTTPKIADLNVTTPKIADLGVTTPKIADLGVTTPKLANNAVTGLKIADATINEVKFDAATRNKLGLASGGTINGDLVINGSLNLANSQLLGFGLDQALTTNLTFGPADADGATRTITTNFQPRMVLVNGAVSFRFAPGQNDNFRYGGVTNGVATLAFNSVQTQTCTGPKVQRFSTGNFAFYADSFSGIAGAFFQNSFTAPTGTTTVVITVSQVSFNGLTFRLSRTVNSGTPSIDAIQQFLISVTVLGHNDFLVFPPDGGPQES